MPAARGPYRVDLQNPVAAHPLNHGLHSWHLALPGLYGGQGFWDLRGRNHAGSFVSISWQPGIKGFGAPVFTVSRMSLPRPMPVDQGGITFFFRANWDGASVNNKIPLDTTGGTQMAFWFDNSRQWSMYYGGTRASTAAQSFASGTILHVAMSYDRINGPHAVYVNGLESGTGSATYAATESATTVLGGFTGGGADAAMDLFSLRIHNRPLKSADAMGEYLEAMAGYPNLLRRYPDRSWFVLRESAEAAAGDAVPQCWQQYARRAS